MGALQRLRMQEFVVRDDSLQFLYSLTTGAARPQKKAWQTQFLGRMKMNLSDLVSETEASNGVKNSASAKLPLSLCAKRQKTEKLLEDRSGAGISVSSDDEVDVGKMYSDGKEQVMEYGGGEDFCDDKSKCKDAVSSCQGSEAGEQDNLEDDLCDGKSKAKYPDSSCQRKACEEGNVEEDFCDGKSKGKYPFSSCQWSETGEQGNVEEDFSDGKSKGKDDVSSCQGSEAGEQDMEYCGGEDFCDGKSKGKGAVSASHRSEADEQGNAEEDSCDGASKEKHADRLSRCFEAEEQGNVEEDFCDGKLRGKGAVGSGQGSEASERVSAETGTNKTLFEKLWDLDDRIKILVSSGHFVESVAPKALKVHIRSILAQEHICQMCGVQRPTKKAEELSGQKWYGDMCPFCAMRNRQRIASKMDVRSLVVESLSHRIHHEAKQAIAKVPEEFTRTFHMRRTHVAKLDVAANCFKVPTGKNIRTQVEVSDPALVGTMRRTLARISEVPEVMEHTTAYSDFFKMVGFD